VNKDATIKQQSELIIKQHKMLNAKDAKIAAAKRLLREALLIIFNLPIDRDQTEIITEINQILKEE